MNKLFKVSKFYGLRFSRLHQIKKLCQYDKLVGSLHWITIESEPFGKYKEGIPRLGSVFMVQ
jgi:hypothetical protein